MAALEIDCLQLSMRATTVPSRAAAVEQRVREAMQGHLPRALESVAAIDDDMSLTFIDRLSVHSQVSTAWDDERIVAVFARALAAQLIAAVDERAHASGVRRFDDRAAWIAEFLTALVDGVAWQRWWFEELDGLRTLPLSVALRTVIVNEGDNGVLALVRLTPDGVRRVLRAVNSADVASVVSAWQSRRSQERVALPRLWRAGHELLRDARLQTLLGAAVELEREQSGAINSRTLTLLADMADLMQARNAGWPIERADLEPRACLLNFCAAAGMAPEWLHLLDVDETNALLDLLIESPAQTAGRGSQTSTGAAADPVPPSAAVWRARTEYGGAFILLTVLTWLRWLDVWRRVFARFADTAAVADELAHCLGLAVVARVLLPDQPQRVLGDLGLKSAWLCCDPRKLLQYHGRRVRTALRAVGVRKARASTVTSDPWLSRAATMLTQALSARVPGCAGASADYLRRNLLTVSAGIGYDPQTAQVDVMLTRAPLHVLLMIAGLTRSTVQLGSHRIVTQTEDA